MSAKTCYLHIGMHKTGTSSIQRSLRQSREVLQEYSINYCGFIESHGFLRSVLTKEPELLNFNIIHGFALPELCAARDAVLRDSLIRELEETKCNSSMLSAENFSLLSLSEVLELKKLLDPFFAEFKIVIYVREPFSFLSSYAQQILKEGATYDSMVTDTLSIDRSVRYRGQSYLISKQTFNNSLRPSYRYCIEKFINVFGRDHVTIKDFTPSTFKNNCVVTDFLDTVLPGKGVAEAINIHRINESMSQGVGNILESINRRHPIIRNGVYNHDRARRVQAYLHSSDQNQKFVFNQIDRSRYVEAIRSDVEWLSEITQDRVSYDLTSGDDRSHNGPDMEQQAYRDDLIDAINMTAVKAENERSMRRFLSAMIAYDKRGTYRSGAIFRMINNCCDLSLLKVMCNNLRVRRKIQEAHIALQKMISINTESKLVRSLEDKLGDRVSDEYDFSDWFQ